jgi:hypothetical protein
MSNYWKSNFQTSNFQTSKLTKRLHSEASFSDSDTKLAKPKVPSLTKLFYSIKDTVCSLWFHHGPFCSGMDPTCSSLCMVPHWSAKVPSLSTMILLVCIRDLMWFCQGFYIFYFITFPRWDTWWCLHSNHHSITIASWICLSSARIPSWLYHGFLQVQGCPDLSPRAE